MAVWRTSGPIGMPQSRSLERYTSPALQLESQPVDVGHVDSTITKPLHNAEIDEIIQHAAQVASVSAAAPRLFYYRASAVPSRVDRPRATAGGRCQREHVGRRCRVRAPP